MPLKTGAIFETRVLVLKQRLESGLVFAEVCPEFGGGGLLLIDCSGDE